jgi:repressor LexA
MDTVGSRLKQLRAEDGRTQLEIAAALKQYEIKADRGTVARWENDIQQPTLRPVKYLAKLYGVTTDFIIDGSNPGSINSSGVGKNSTSIRIPVFGNIQASFKITDAKDILDWEEIDLKKFGKENNYFGLIVKGDSMYPEYQDGDVIIVQQSSDVASGKDVLVCVNGSDAFLSRYYKYESGVKEFRSLNPIYPGSKYTAEEALKASVAIIGFVRELRRRK